MVVAGQMQVNDLMTKFFGIPSLALPCSFWRPGRLGPGTSEVRPNTNTNRDKNVVLNRLGPKMISE